MLWLLGQRGESEEKVTDEEIKMLVAEAEHHGTIESDERRMIAGVMRLGDRAVRAVMTPRTEVDWINLAVRRSDDPQASLTETAAFPPAGRRRRVDAMVGVVQTARRAGRDACRPPLDRARHVAPGSDRPRPGRRAGRAGHAQGIATCRWRWSMTNTAISKASSRRPTFWRRSLACSAPTSTPATRTPVQRDDGSWLLAGYMPADEMADHLGIDLPETRDYETVAGFVLAHCTTCRRPASRSTRKGWRFEVVDLDGRRIDKVIATRLPGSRRERR